MSAPDPWGAARDRATWENQAWAAGALAERERWRQEAITRGATYETYTGKPWTDCKTIRAFADLLRAEAPGD